MSAIKLPSIFRAVQEIFPDTVLRTGFSTETKAAFIVAADLRQGVGHTGSTNKFLQPLDVKGGTSSSPLYVGDEVVFTAGVSRTASFGPGRTGLAGPG